MIQRYVIKGFFIFLEVLVKMGETPIMILLRVVTWITGWLTPMFLDQSVFERVADVAYGKSPNQKLDVIRLRKKSDDQLLPVIFLVHGGGFQFFSKGAHTLIAKNLAKMGCVVFNVEYGLAPENPYPNGLNDVLQAYDWVLKNAKDWGGDIQQIRCVGESAGANLLMGLLLVLYDLVPKSKRVEVVDLDQSNQKIQKPTHWVLHCGLLQVSNPERWDHDARATEVSKTRIRVIQKNYLGKFKDQSPIMADPLLVFESLTPEKAKTIAPIFVPVGHLDWVYTDSKRLADAIQKVGGKVQFKDYPNQGHAFYFKFWGIEPKILFQDIEDFFKDAT